MKKLLSVLISIEMFFLSIGIQAFAATNHINSYNNSELDLSQYTLEDIGNMSAVEFRKLLADFERVYDPFDTYETDPIMAENTTSLTEEDIGNTASPQWGSGEIDKDGNHTEVGSHEMITARACVILTSDKGFFSSNAAESVAIALTISIASLLPDKDSSSHADAFAGHFYDPTTEKNWKHQTDNTAKTHAHEDFILAVQALENNNKSVAYEHLGRALHYLQDACQPQHASNFTAVSVPAGAHGAFEDYVDENIETYTNRINSVIGHNFTQNKSYKYIARTPAYFVKEAAAIAYQYKSYTNKYDLTSSKIDWNTAANVCVQNAAAFSALMLYSFAGFADISLYK